MYNERKLFIDSIFFPTIFVVLIWAVKLIEFSSEADFSSLGIYPLKIKGLIGIITSPFIHGSFEHLLSNTFPLYFLSVGVFYFYPEIKYKVFLFIYLFEGIFVWLAAREAYHVGASGLIYGFAAFLFFSGIFRKNRQLLAISLLVVFLYGSMIWGIFPIKEKVSWESHLMGLVAGIFLSFYYKKEIPSNQYNEIDFDDNDFTQVHITGNAKKIIYFYKEKDNDSNNETPLNKTD